MNAVCAPNRMLEGPAIGPIREFRAAAVVVVLFVLSGCRDIVSVDSARPVLESHGSSAAIIAEPLHVIQAAQPEIGDRFGYAVARVGEGFLVGAWGTDGGSRRAVRRR